MDFIGDEVVGCFLIKTEAGLVLLARTITDGMPNPFVMGEEGYHYYEQQFYHYVLPTQA